MSPSRFAAVCVLLSVFVAVAVAWPLAEPRNVNIEQLIRIRCSLNPNDETLFFFNGTVNAFTQNPYNATILFKTVGVNVARCWKRADGSYTLASREFLYYIDPVTDQILNSWTNPWTGETVTVMHVDNDPVLQQLPAAIQSPGMIAGDDYILSLDVVLQYPNALANQAQFPGISPSPLYQAGEFFKFIAPTSDVFSDIDTVSKVLVTWNRVGPFLPFMKMGNQQGYLAYSSFGNRVPDWTYLPDQVKADVANRVPHYKHAPTCIPDTRSVTSWNFFAAHVQDYNDGAQFPLSQAAVYPCVNYTPPAAPACRATVEAQIQSTWVSGSEVHYSVNLVLKNIGTKDINALSVRVENTVVDNAWNLNQQPSSNVYNIQLWNTFNAGATLSGSYGFNSHTGPAVVTVASVTCNN